jgi:hypothetical protein
MRVLYHLHVPIMKMLTGGRTVPALRDGDLILDASHVHCTKREPAPQDRAIG